MTDLEYNEAMAILNDEASQKAEADSGPTSDYPYKMPVHLDENQYLFLRKFQKKTQISKPGLIRTLLKIFIMKYEYQLV
jgi:hypothetical protein